MGTEYNHHHRHNHYHRSSFMPMLCSRSSTKDSVVSFSDKNKHYYKDEPASPRVGCLGQIKRNNKVIGFPTHHKYNNEDSNRNYFKLKRIFSSKSLSSTSSRRHMIMGGISGDHEKDYVSLSILDLDPPLPVNKAVQRVSKGGDDGISLWKRRCGGDALKGLQLLQITPQPSSIS